ncbi:MAG: AI-2E family transporter [Lewinellaceae bacterium]|nr:AI-2E family transporter [Phaeodactylibacter sp.]MCB9351636.1 AI-2E family transporter [Lewinellaceae bacterium]
MSNININLQRIAYLLVILSLTTYIIIIGKSLIVPIAFSALFSFLLLPICRKIETRAPYRPGAIILSMIAALLPILTAIGVFSYQLTTVLQDMPSITGQLKKGISHIFSLAERYLDLDSTSLEEWLRTNLTSMLDAPLQLLGDSLTSSTAVLAGLVLTLLFTFFALLYRTSFKNFALTQVPKTVREEATHILEQVQHVAQEYLYGLLLVIVILGCLNSLGLWLIGISFPLFWGFLGAFLAIIPYIGTTLGGIFPFLYALATTSTFWQPAAVVLLYSTVQALEGNIITPKVVGSSVSINPLAAILSLFAGGLIWGVSGLILALPLVAILKVLMDHITPLQPFSELLGSDLYRKSDIFFEKYDKEEYRFINYFSDRRRRNL